VRFLDVCGAPGSGKSTLCDHFWHPHAIRWTDDPGVPQEWDGLLEVCDSLLEGLKDHPTYPNLLGMTKRSLHKMATVYRRQDSAVYIQTGFAQRGLGFGWRLAERGKVDLVREYFQLMPVSLGVVLVDCPIEVAIERNRQRELNPVTAYENRAHMVPLMHDAIVVMLEELYDRGVAVAQVDATKPIDDARRDLVRFAAERAAQTEAARSGGEVAPVP
jgi:hypothetical protein